MENITCMNGNILVQLVTEQVTTKAGLTITSSDARGKKDIVAAKILADNSKLPEGATVYFPLYAAQPISLNGLDGHIVNLKDIVLIKK